MKLADYVLLVSSSQTKADRKELECNLIEVLLI